ncbi:DUF4893 domain-containing protein [Phenylobacterium sp.]|jgi:hypothetical protein|uniref:DUF4893 domain-containing protein n=1 Tax=Phenylobacterium sp. TaxID=1871053 RepID=UPI00378377DC
MKIAALTLAAAALTATSGFAASANWRDDATREDVLRVAQLDQAWAQARQESAPRDLARLGAVVRPGGALTRPEPAPGAYRCRTIKLGVGQAGSGAGAIAYGWFQCRVALSPGGDLTLRKTTGSQRPMGNLYPQTRRRLVYLGAVAWGQERDAAYGRDPERDQAGVFERIGPNHYRLVLPYPKVESTLDIIELKR